MYADRSRLTKPLLLALLLHLVLAGLFLLVNLASNVRNEEFFEVALSQAPVKGSPHYQDIAPEKRLRPVSGAQEMSSDLVNLPTRRMLLDNEQIKLSALDDKLIDESKGTAGDKITQLDHTHETRESNQPGSTLAFGKRGIKEYDGKETTHSTKYVYGSQTGTKESSLYNLEWVTGGDRRVLEQVLPAYPPGLAKETRIKLTFAVLPDGTVDMVLPLQKGEPRLETITLDAFKKWKFEPLSPAAKQVKQEGKITFIFKLK